MKRLAVSSAVLAAISLVMLAVSPRDGNAQATTIDTGSFYFCSASFESGICDTTVTAGSTVTWQVSGGVHNVTECDATFATCPPAGGFDSGQLSSGGTFAQTFNAPGTISYYCAFHPDQMRGRILVQAQATATTVPTVTSSPSAQTPPVVTAGPTTVSGPAQIPASGGQTGDSLPWLALAIGVTLVAIGGAAGCWALGTVRSRSDGRQD